MNTYKIYRKSTYGWFLVTEFMTEEDISSEPMFAGDVFSDSEILRHDLVGSDTIIFIKQPNQS